MKKNMISHSPRITAATHTDVLSALKDSKIAQYITQHQGGSMNIVFPDIAVENVEKFFRVSKNMDVPMVVAVAHKPNKSQSIARHIATQTNAHIDVASLGELHSALRAGFAPERICAGGPKNTLFLTECVTQGVSVSVDSISELTRLIDICAHLGVRQCISVFVRINVESVLADSVESRFGVLVDEIDAALVLLQKSQNAVRFLGFACHINADAKKKRAVVFEKMMSFTHTAVRLGLSPTHINMGGGFRTNYVSSEQEWQDVRTAIHQSALDPNRCFGWNNTTFGLWSEQGIVRGTPQFSDLYLSSTSSDELSDFLLTHLSTFETTVAQVLIDSLLTLVIEPGRAVYADAGVTVTRIIDKKRTSLANQVLIVDMNRSQLDVSDQMYLLDPVVYPYSTDEHVPYHAFVAGNLCLKSDILIRHYATFSREPNVGEQVVFFNTAGYFMNFTESNTLQQPLADAYMCVADNSVWSLEKDI